MFGNRVIVKRLIKVALGIAVAVVLAMPAMSYAVTWDQSVEPPITVNSVPEPSNIFLLGFGLIGLRVFISYRSNKMKRLPAKTP
jgi:hypothetical protein